MFCLGRMQDTHKTVRIADKLCSEQEEIRYFQGSGFRKQGTVLRLLQLGWICCSWLAIPVLLYLDVSVWRGSWIGPPWLAAWLEKSRSPWLTVLQDCTQKEGAIPQFEYWGTVPQDERIQAECKTNNCPLHRRDILKREYLYHQNMWMILYPDFTDYGAPTSPHIYV